MDWSHEDTIDEDDDDDDINDPLLDGVNRTGSSKNENLLDRIISADLAVTWH